jgi:hypothetical protein
MLRRKVEGRRGIPHKVSVSANFLFVKLFVRHYTLALEMLSLLDDDVKEGVSALRSRRPPMFPSASEPFEETTPP